MTQLSAGRHLAPATPGLGETQAAGLQGARRSVNAERPRRRRSVSATLAAVLAAGALLAGCAGPPSAGRPLPSSTATPAGGIPHIMVIMEENQSYSATLGSCGSGSPDPYWCSLAATYASGTGWYGVQHPSLPNYLDMVSGADHGCTADTCPISVGGAGPDLGGQLSQAGIPWVAWMESMPRPCDTGGDSGNYEQHHDPFAYFTDVTASTDCSTDLAPYPGASAMVSALDGGDAPDLVWLTPNVCDDMHTACTSTNQITVGDDWLKSNLPGVLQSSWFEDGGTVIITMDEDEGDNSGCCGDAAGGSIPITVISGQARGFGNFSSAGDHYGVLRSLEEAFHLSLLGGAQNPANGDLSSLLG
jgi:phosphatidylinositol-3-phosphatase